MCTIHFICNAMLGTQVGREWDFMHPTEAARRTAEEGCISQTNNHHQKWWFVSVSEVSCECSCNTSSCLVSSTGQNPPLPLPLPSPFCSWNGSLSIHGRLCKICRPVAIKKRHNYWIKISKNMTVLIFHISLLLFSYFNLRLISQKFCIINHSIATLPAHCSACSSAPGLRSLGPTWTLQYLPRNVAVQI